MARPGDPAARHPVRAPTWCRPGAGGAVAGARPATTARPPTAWSGWSRRPPASARRWPAAAPCCARSPTPASCAPAVGPRRGSAPDDLLDRLAAVGPSRVAGLAPGVEQLCRAAGDGPVVCLLGAVGPDDVVDLVRAPLGPDDRPRGPGRHRRAGPRPRPGRGRRALSARLAGDARPRSGRTRATLLRAAGWRVAVARAGPSVAQTSGPRWAGRPQSRPPRRGRAAPGCRHDRAGRPAARSRRPAPPCWARWRSLPVFSSAAWLRPVLAVVLVVLAGGLLLRGGGPALWARAGAAAARCPPAGRRRRRRRAARAARPARCACSPPSTRPATRWCGCCPRRRASPSSAAVLADGAAEMRSRRTPALPLTGLLALTALFVGLVAVVGRPGRRGRPAGRRSPGWGCSSSTASR